MLKILFIFSIFSMIGWIIESIYRFIMTKKVVNPGFMSGCVVPIYGFGAIILYGICKLSESFSYKYEAILVIIISMISLSILELLSGLFLLKYFNLRLWDYSKRKFNFKGIICLRFTLYWGILALIFYIFTYNFIDNLVLNIVNNSICLFLLGLFYGIFLIDLCISINLSSKIKKYAESNKKVIDLEKLKVDIIKRINKNRFINMLYPYISTNVFLKSKIKDNKNDL